MTRVQRILRTTSFWQVLASMCCVLFFFLVASGTYLYLFLDTSVSGAFVSVDRMSRESPWTGGLLRSVHRYAADGFLVLTWLHLLREMMLGRFRRHQSYSWWTGLPLLVLLYVAAIGGFWLNWDRLGQFAAETSAEWLDALPFLVVPFARNFLNAAMVSDRLFSLLVFVHIGVPLLIAFALWFHVQRLNRPAVWPRLRVWMGVAAALLMLAVTVPVLSQAPADLGKSVAVAPIDWWLLHWLPVSEWIGGGSLWVLLSILLMGLVLLPWLPASSHRSPAAVVDAAHCSGCRLCVADCPYEAIQLAPHPNLKPGRQIAVVDADRCAACGICVGACPTANPLLPRDHLISGVDLPHLAIDAFRRRLVAGLSAPNAPRRVLFACGEAAQTFDHDEVLVLTFNCAAQLPPTFVDLALRLGAIDVWINSCSTGACAYRLGGALIAERLARTRSPRLRRDVPASAWHLTQFDRGAEVALFDAWLNRPQTLRLRE